MNTKNYHIEVVYPSGDGGQIDDYETKEQAIIAFKELVKENKEDFDSQEVDYAHLFYTGEDVEVDEYGRSYKNIMLWSFHCGFTTEDDLNNPVINAFDSLSNVHDDLIDECFYEWAKQNGITYWSLGEGDYPNEFKIYFMNNGGIEQ